jgi:hypothetical protein
MDRIISYIEVFLMTKKIVISKKENQIFNKVMGKLVGNNTIPHKQYDKIKDTIEILKFSWKKLAIFAIWFSIASFVISAGALLGDRKIIQIIILLFFNTPKVIMMVIFGVLSSLILWWGYIRKKTNPQRYISNEIILFCAAITTFIAIDFMDGVVSLSKLHFHFDVLLSSLAFGVIGYCYRSKFIWFLSIFTFGSWMGAQTGYYARYMYYWISMDNPLYFIVFGMVLISLALVIRKVPSLRMFYNVTRNFGLLYFFIALWCLDLLGINYRFGSEEAKLHLMYCSLIFALGSVCSIYIGLRLDDKAFRSYGIVFLFINLFTTYFQMFWDSIHKAILFFIFGVCLLLIGLFAERIWIKSEKLLKRIKI